MVSNALRTVAVGLGLLGSVVVLGGCTSFFQKLGSVPAAQSTDMLQLEGKKGKGKLAGCAQDLPGGLESLVAHILNNPEAQQLKAKLEKKGKKIKRQEAQGCKVKTKKGKGNGSNGFWSPLQATDPATSPEATLVEVPFGDNASLFALISPADEQLTWANLDEGERVVVMDATEEQTYLNPQDDTSAQALDDLQQDAEFQGFLQELASQGIALDSANVEVIAQDVPGVEEVDLVVALPEAAPVAPAGALTSGNAPTLNFAFDPGIHYFKGRAKRVTPTTSTTARKVSLKVVPSSGRVRRAQEFDPAVQTWCPHSWTSRISKFRGPLCDSYELKVSKPEVRQTMLSRANVASDVNDTYSITYSRSRINNTELLLAGFKGLTESQIKDFLDNAQPFQAQAQTAWESAQRARPLLQPLFERYRPDNLLGPDDGVTQPGEGTVENEVESLYTQILSTLGLANGNNEVTRGQLSIADGFKDSFIKAFEATFNPALREICGAIRELAAQLQELPTKNPLTAFLVALLGQLSPDDVECAHKSMKWVRPLVEHLLTNQFGNPAKITKNLEKITVWLKILAGGNANQIKGVIGEMWVALTVIQPQAGWVIQEINFEYSSILEIDLILYKPERNLLSYVEVKNRNDSPENLVGIQKDIADKLERFNQNLDGVRDKLKQSQIHAEVEFATFVFTQNGDFSSIAQHIRDRFGNTLKLPVTVAWRDKDNQAHVECIGCNSKFTQVDAEQAACEMGICVSSNDISSAMTNIATVVTGAGLGGTGLTSSSFCRGGVCLI